MVMKFLSVIATFIIAIFFISYVFQHMPGPPVALKVDDSRSSFDDRFDYGAAPVFADNLRFSHNLISYNIDEGCNSYRKDMMTRAFHIFTSETGVVSFYESKENPDIEVSCSNEFVDLGDELFAAGEGGPSRIINTSWFKVIEKGNILLYDDGDCDYPVVALHELGHVFGFAHSNDTKNIMYNTSDCDQRISENMIKTMKTLYSLEALPDARIDSVEGNIRGRFLSFNISVLNEGLVGIDDINLTIFADGEEVDSVNLGDIDVGYGRSLDIQNMMLNGPAEEIKFVLDNEGVVSEMDEDNNVIFMSV